MKSSVQLTSFLFYLAFFCTVKAKACPDGSSCSVSMSCCHLPEGGYGCCPDAAGVCCAIGHTYFCCPAGTTCVSNINMCNKSPSNDTSSVTKSSVDTLSTITSKVKINYCPGGAVYCQDQQTCCLLPNGQWGCCPFPSAFCCADRIHCCPYGKHCDATYTQCIPNGNSEPSQKKYKASSVTKSSVDTLSTTTSKVKINYCPGGAVYCQDQQTCCLLPNGQWGCCPFQYAFCCADRIHCCPYGQHCDATFTQCLRNGNSVPSQKKYKAFPIEKLLNKYNEQ